MNVIYICHSYCHVRPTYNLIEKHSEITDVIDLLV